MGIRVKDDPDSIVTLKFQPAPAYIPIVQHVVEGVAKAAGLTPKLVYKLSLAVEETCLYISQIPDRRGRVKCTVTPRAASIETAFTFAAEDVSLAGLNLQARRDQGLELAECGDFINLGLLLAAHSVDRLSLGRPAPGRFRLTLIQDRDYPRLEPETVCPPPATPPIRVTRNPDHDPLVLACRLAAGIHPAWELPESIFTPGKLVDLVAAGDIEALVASDARGHVVGFLIWRPEEKGAATFHGPYVFCTEFAPDVAGKLIDAMLATLARTGATGVFTSRTLPYLPGDEFDVLGQIAYLLPDGSERAFVARYRSLGEDLGRVVYAPPSLEGPLRKEYDRLALGRDMLPAEPTGSRLPEHSLFSTDIAFSRSEAVLRPLLEGRDIGENIERHVTALLSQDIMNILFLVDLGQAWQARLAEALVNAAFRLAFIQPEGGQGDIAWLQYVPNHAS